MASTRQSELLESARHLDWLPDETLYSLASRHHRLSGNLRPEQTARQLFGHSRGGSPHDLPAGLDHFEAVLGTRLGSSDVVALERTILPGHFIFRSSSSLHDAVRVMRSPSLGGLKSRMGLPASGFGATCLLKACPSCMRIDASDHGTAYWRRTHQLPGASMCLVHQEPLLVSLADRARQFRFDWRLPFVADLTEAARRKSHSRGESPEFMSRLAQMSADAVTTVGSASRSGAQHAKALWAGMKARGWVAKSGRLNRDLAVPQWKVLLMMLGDLPEGCGLVASESAAYSQLVSLLRDPTHGHVLRPLALVTFLFDDWNHYLENLDGSPSEVDSEVLDLQVSGIECVKNKLHALIAGGESITAAANRLGVAVASAQAWLAELGHVSPKRPSKIRDDTLARVLEGLRNGMDVSRVAESAGTSDASVRRVLRTTVGLRGEWVEAKRKIGLDRARKDWMRALEVSASSGPKAARLIEPKAYAWLYRNDRVWLMEANEKARHPRGGNNSSVDWDARDRALAMACQSAALVLIGGSKKRRISMTEIVRVVPEVRTKLHRLENLPLTARVVRDLAAGRYTLGSTDLTRSSVE